MGGWAVVLVALLIVLALLLVVFSVLVRAWLRARAIVAYHTLSLEDWERYMQRHYVEGGAHSLELFRPGIVLWIARRFILPRYGDPW